MNQTTAQKALHFMDRVQLTGAEVPVWIEVASALHSLANPAPKPGGEVVQHAQPVDEAMGVQL